MRSAPDMLFMGTLCVFSFLNARAMPKPDRVRYDARGFNVRFVPKTGAFAPILTPRDAVAALPLARAGRSAVTPSAFVAAGEAVEPSAESSAQAWAPRGPKRAELQEEDAASTAASKARVQEATKGVEAGRAYFAGDERKRASLAAATESEAAAAAPKLREAQIKEAGAEPGLLRSLWPITVRLLLNNKTFNDSLYENPWTKKVCGDPAFLRGYLADGKNPDGVKRELGHVFKLLEDPNATRAAAGTQFAQKMLDCPSVQSLTRDRAAIASLAKDNPQLLKVLANPTALEVLKADPRAAPLLKEVQKALEP